MTICSGCGDTVIPRTGCCVNCRRGTFGVDNKMVKRVRDLYFQDGRNPVKIYKMLRVHPEVTRKICYGKPTVELT